MNDNSPRCPTCKTHALGTHATSAGASIAQLGQLLREANPLANRILGRVQVRCPLHDQGCTWRGDLSEVSAHLMSSEAHVGGQGAKAATAETAGASAGKATAASGAAPARMASRGKAASPAAGSAEATALALKDQANAHFESRNFTESIKCVWHRVRGWWHMERAVLTLCLH